MLGPEVSDCASSTRIKSSPSVGEVWSLDKRAGLGLIVFVSSKESLSSAIFGAVVGIADDMFWS